MSQRGEALIPIVLAASGAVKGKRCVVYWAVVKYANTAGNLDLRNGTTAAGTSLCHLGIGTATNLRVGQKFEFDPPILFPDGCYATLTNVSVVTVGYN